MTKGRGGSKYQKIDDVFYEWPLNTLYIRPNSSFIFQYSVLLTENWSITRSECYYITALQVCPKLPQLPNEMYEYSWFSYAMWYDIITFLRRNFKLRLFGSCIFWLSHPHRHENFQKWFNSISKVKLAWLIVWL